MRKIFRPGDLVADRLGLIGGVLSAFVNCGSSDSVAYFMSVLPDGGLVVLGFGYSTHFAAPVTVAFAGPVFRW